MTERKQIEVEADSIAEARNMLKSQVPDGLDLGYENIISNGKPKSIKANAKTIEEAFGKLGENEEVTATPAEIQAMAVVQVAELDYLKDTTNLIDKQKSLLAGVKENLLGLAYWVGEKIDKVREKWTVLPQRQKTILKLTGPLVAGVMALTGCTDKNTQTQPIDITPNISPTVEYSPTPIITATETQTPTQATTVTETEAPRFENLKPPTIEECMKNNEIHWDTLDADLGVLKAKAEAVMSPDPSVYGEYKSNLVSVSAKGLMGEYKLTFENPKIAYCAYLNQDGHEFLVLGIYVKSRFGNYSEPIPFAIDLSLNRQKPDYVYDGAYFNFYESLFSNDEANYKKLIEGKAKKLEIYGVNVVGKATESSIHKNLFWLFNEETKLYSSPSFIWGLYINHTSDDNLTFAENNLIICASRLIPTATIVVDNNLK